MEDRSCNLIEELSDVKLDQVLKVLMLFLAALAIPLSSLSVTPVLTA